MKILSVVQNNAWVPHLYVKALGPSLNEEKLVELLTEATPKIHEELGETLLEEDIVLIANKLLQTGHAWILNEEVCVEILDV